MASESSQAGLDQAGAGGLDAEAGRALGAEAEEADAVELGCRRDWRVAARITVCPSASALAQPEPLAADRQDPRDPARIAVRERLVALRGGGDDRVEHGDPRPRRPAKPRRPAPKVPGAPSGPAARVTTISLDRARARKSASVARITISGSDLVERLRHVEQGQADKLDERDRVAVEAADLLDELQKRQDRQERAQNPRAR